MGLFDFFKRKEDKKGELTTTETVTDIDGNLYTTVKIGHQLWTVEDLRTTRLNDGTPIKYTVDVFDWIGLDSPAYCYYNNNPASGVKFGALYNWYAVETGKLAPRGWHVPTNEDWEKLENYLIEHGFNWDGSKKGNKVGKALASNTLWAEDDGEGTVGNRSMKNNRSGFTALPGGCRNDLGTYYDQGYYEYWWTATETDENNAYRYYLGFNHSNLAFSRYYKQYGFGVRVIMNKSM